MSATTASTSQSSTQAMIQGHLFNPETDTKYSKCKTNASGGKSVGIYNTSSGQSLFIGTPLLMTWGIQEYTDDKTGKVSYEMSLQFPNDDFETEETKAFLQAMAGFERKLKADALTNSKEWFAKPKMTSDAVEALFTPILKFPMDKVTCEKDLSKKPTMRIKVPFWQGKWEGVEIYDVDRNCLFPCGSDSDVTPKEIITKLSHMKTMLQCGGIWFANGKFGITWRLVQGMIQPRLSMRGKCHLSLSSSDSSKLQTEAKKTIAADHHDSDDERVPQQKQQHFSTETVDSDDGGEQDEEDDSAAVKRTTTVVPVSAPVTVTVEAPKKKIVKKVVA